LSDNPKKQNLIMQLLDGKKLSDEILAEIAVEVAAIKTKGEKVPHLAAVLVGNDGASETYVASKVRNCEKVGFESTLVRLGAEISQEELIKVIDDLNNNKEIDGFIVQLPLPKHLDVDEVMNRINPMKDVDGFHPANVGRMALNLPTYLPATPNGVLEMLSRYKIPTEGKNCVVLGRSHIVGSPMSILMSRNGYPGNSTVTICHSKTQNLKEITKQADILIVAIGKPEFVTADMVKDGAVVVDVGIHRVPSTETKSGFKLKGDVKFDEVAAKSSFITPVPGGVGLMTICSLLLNTLKAARKEVYG
jgi:methylenetetrahydrofolate dehydrogenase (NADP+) / methenyltetrahydrofolate cyclohydrolase